VVEGVAIGDTEMEWSEVEEKEKGDEVMT